MDFWDVKNCLPLLLKNCVLFTLNDSGPRLLGQARLSHDKDWRIRFALTDFGACLRKGVLVLGGKSESTGHATRYEKAARVLFDYRANCIY